MFSVWRQIWPRLEVFLDALEEVIAFARTASVSSGRRLDVAIVFAESMLRELTITVNDWERAVRALRNQRDRRRWPPLLTAVPDTEAKENHAAN